MWARPKGCGDVHALRDPLRPQPDEGAYRRLLVTPPLVACLAAMTTAQRAAFTGALADDDLAVLEEALAEAEAEHAAAADEAHQARIDESLRERYARWFVDPAAFAREAFSWPAGAELYPYQPKALRTLVADRRLALRSLHGAAKTATASFAVLWFIVTREQRNADWKVVTTASVWRQLKEFLWPEIHKWEKRLRWDLLGMEPWRKGRESLDMAITLGHGSAFAAASNEPAKLEGAHADQLLFVLDEAKTIPAETFDAAEGALSGAGSKPGVDAYAFALSTPGVPAGRFWSICTRQAGTEPWRTQHITLAEAVEAGAVTQEWADSCQRLWASTPGIYANRVLGEFAEDEDGVIPLSWYEAAVERWNATHRDADAEAATPTHAGADIARSGRDSTVVALVAGDCVLRLVRPGSGDSIEVASKVARTVGAGVHGPFVMVDADGVGAGVYDQLMQLREIRQRCAPFHANSSTSHRDRSGELGFVNLRSAAWWFVREALEPAFGATLALPPDDLLMGDLVAPHWELRNVAGRPCIFVEPKPDIAKRIGRSTDSGDSVVMALWGRMVHAGRVIRPSVRTASNGDRSLTGDLLEVSF